MNILFLDQFGELGGAQKCLLDLLPAIVSRGWSARVAAPAGPLLDLARAAGAQTVPIALGHYRNAAKSPRDLARFALETPRLANWIRRQNADLIYVNGPRAMPAAALASRGRPVIFHAHHFLLGDFARRLTAWAVRRARATVIANSRHVATQFGPAHVIYNGVPEIPFTRRAFAQNGWRIGLVGRIAPMKGQTDFLRAAALLPRSFGARFILCGEPMFSHPGYWAEVRRLARNLPVEFAGWRDDVGAVLAGLDLIVVPSNAAEATTRVILEAWSAGVPVVAYAAGGIPEIVRDSVNGFLVPECEPRALAQKILDVSNLDLARVAERARAQWERDFTLDRWRDQVACVIESCSTASAAPSTAWERPAANDAPRAS